MPNLIKLHQSQNLISDQSPKIREKKTNQNSTHVEKQYEIRAQESNDQFRQIKKKKNRKTDENKTLGRISHRSKKRNK